MQVAVQEFSPQLTVVPSQAVLCPWHITEQVPSVEQLMVVPVQLLVHVQVT